MTLENRTFQIRALSSTSLRNELFVTLKLLKRKIDLRSFFLQVNKYVGTSRVKISVLDVTFFTRM